MTEVSSNRKRNINKTIIRLIKSVVGMNQKVAKYSSEYLYLQ